MIVHHGTANAGHYVTYRRLDSGTWLYASDDVVREVSREEVQRQQVYYSGMSEIVVLTLEY